MKKTIYLDYAAATPVDAEVLRAMIPYFNESFHNPSSIYIQAKAVKRELEKCRLSVSQILGVRPGEITFTAGATEANNMAISGLMRGYPEAEVLVSSIEHESVLAPARLQNCRLLPVDTRGIIDLQQLQRSINDKTLLVSVMLVNNEIGTIQPLSEISKLINEEKTRRRQSGNSLPIYLHTDAAQAANVMDLKIPRLGVDMLSLNGGKIYGPKQSGILYVRAGIELRPIVVGGGQEHGLRSGTENMAAIAGFTAALQSAQSNFRAERARLSHLRENLIVVIADAFPTAVFNGSLKLQSPHILSVTFPGSDSERLVMELDEAGIQCASGSACSASSQKPSHVLEAIGLSDADARSTLRFSFGRQTEETDLTLVAKELIRLINR